MFASYKNSYLQLEPIWNPLIINRQIQAARSVPCIDEHDLNPPFNRLASEQPSTPPNYLVNDLKPIGYGVEAYVQLREKLNNSEENSLLLNSLETVLDLVKDPEKTIRAAEYGLIGKLGDLLFNVNNLVRLKTFEVLTEMAKHGFCKMLIVEDQLILDALQINLLEDDVAFNIKALELIELLAVQHEIVDTLIDMGLLQVVLENLQTDKDDVMLAKLKVLSRFLYCSGKCKSFRYDLCEKLMEPLNSNNQSILVATLDCFMQLMSTKMGRNLALKQDILKRLIELLYNKDKVIYKAATGALMNFTLKGKVQLLIYYKHYIVVEQLIAFTMEKADPSLQIFAIQALINLSEFQKMALVLQKFSNKLKCIPVGDDRNVEKFKNTLIQGLDDAEAF